MRIFCARKLAGLAICMVRYGDIGYPFSLPSATPQGERSKISI